MNQVDQNTPSANALPKEEWVNRFAIRLQDRINWTADEARREAESSYTTMCSEDFRNPEEAADAAIQEMANDA